MYFYFPMKTLNISNELHKEWKIFCSKKDIRIMIATELAIELAMKTYNKNKKLES